MNPPPSPRLSAVITSLNEERTLETFVGLLLAALERTGWEYEIILVDDGSRDRTFVAMTRLFQEQTRIKAALRLMKNAGQPAAITAGLAEAGGSHVLMMDSDLQLTPDDLEAFVAAARDGADIVNGYRPDRRDSVLRRLPSAGANWIMRRVAGARLRDFGCTFRLVDRSLIAAFALGPERILSIPLLVSRAGRIVEVPVRHRARPSGKSGWTFLKLWRYNADNVVLLAEPVFQWMGMASLGIAALLILRVVLDPFLHWSLLGPVTNGLVLNAIVAAALILTGLTCTVGEFVVRCHRSVLARPAYVIKERMARGPTDAAG